MPICKVGVEPALDRPRGELQSLASHSDLESPEIEAGDGSRTYEALDLSGDFLADRLMEPLFSAASAAATRSSWASAQVSLACQ